MIRLCHLALLAATVPLSAQVSGPVLGYAQQSGGLRAILGVPGAAYFTDPLELEGAAALAYSAEGRYVLALAPNNELRILRYGRTLETSPMLALRSAPVKALVSPKGTSAAVLREDGAVDVVAGLPDRPFITRTFQPGADAIPTAIADDGNAIAALENGHTVLVFTTSGTIAAASGAAIRELRFLPGSHDLLFTDAGARQIGLIRDGTVAAILAGPADGLEDARAAAYAGSGRILVIADAARKELIFQTAETGTAQRIAVGCTPSTLERLNDSTLRAGCDASTRSYLIYVSDAGTRVLFIPEPVN